MIEDEMKQTTNTTAGIDMDAAQLDKLEALARAATPGPWEATRQTDDECSFIGYFIEAGNKTISDDGTAPGAADAQFIAAANPATVLHLIELARRSTSGSDEAEYNAKLRKEVAIMAAMLDDGEWAEHVATTAHGQCLETAITKLVGKANAAHAPASGSDGTAAAGAGRLPAFTPSEQQYADWCERHDLPDHLSRDAFDDATSLYLTATSGSELAPDAGKKGVTTLLQAAGAMRLVRCHIGSGEPFEAYDMDIADRVVAELRAQLAQQAAICQPLTDGQIVGVLHSLGVDTYPSKYGFDVLQVSATSVPTIRTVVEKCAALAHQSPSINQQGGAPIGYLPAYEISRLQSGHDANVRSAKFGPSTLNGDVAVYLAAPTRATQADQDAMDATRWSKEPPTEQGEYWNWDGDEDHSPMIYHVLWSGTAKKCFVSMGQYDIKNAIWCDEFGGWWLKIEQPSISAGGAAIAASKEGA